MSIILPDQKILTKMSKVLDEVNVEYSKFLELNRDDDNIEYLTELLNEKTEEYIPYPNISWSWDDAPRNNPGEWLSGIAGFVSNEYAHSVYIDIILWSDNLEQKWGPITFKEIVLKMLGHETIHLNQYVRIGYDKLGGIASGHEKGQKLSAKTGNDRDWKRLYLRDPHELMAYGHDLAIEIKSLTNPEEALRSPESFIDELPVYELFRQIFPINARPLRDMLSYAARYFNHENT